MAEWFTQLSDKQSYLILCLGSIWASGGTGIRKGLKIPRREDWGFDSPLAHHFERRTIMTRYVIFAAEQMYGGLHGMNSTFVIEAESEHEVEFAAEQASLDIIDSYECIREIIFDDIDIDDDELRQDACYEDVMYEWALIDEELAGNYSTKELDSMAYDMGYEEFVEAYCSYTC